MKITQDIKNHFFPKVLIVDKDKCWIWNASKYNNGYGQMNINGKNTGAHRISYMIHKGNIPKGMFVMHLCDVRDCVNPNHLSVGTRADNMKDAANKKRIRHGEQHHGAKLSKENVRIIREKIKQGITQQLIANEFGIQQSQVSRIKLGLRWKE